MTIPAAYYGILKSITSEPRARIPGDTFVGFIYDMEKDGLIHVDNNTSVVTATNAGLLALADYESSNRNKVVEIIVMAWDKDSGKSYGVRLSHDVIMSEEKAQVIAGDFCKPGLCVVVRPKYNDDNDLSFHEFQSFDGGPFKRVEFKNK